MRRSLILAVIFVLASSCLSFANKVVKQYYPSGKIYTSQVYYDNGMVKGPYKIYWPNGRLRQKVIYKNYKVFKIETWSENGVRLH